MEVPSKFGEFSENKESVEEVVVGGGETLGVDEYESNKVVLVLKDGCSEFDDSLDEINLGLSEEFVIRVLEGRDVFGEKSREVFSVKPWATEGRRRVLCYVQGNLDEHPKGQQMEKEIKGLSCTPSVPAVFIGQELIGGANEKMTLHLKVQLVPLLLRANAIWVWRSELNNIKIDSF
ncbi:monothiol glutaredoxin-S2-like protein [Tanacetum coccineum]